MAREPVCATGNATVYHMLKKTSASIARYHISKCSCGYSGDRVCKEIQELATPIVHLSPLSPTVPRHDGPPQKRRHVNCPCVFRSRVTSEALRSRLACDQRREHDATAHDALHLNVCSIWVTSLFAMQWLTFRGTQNVRDRDKGAIHFSQASMSVARQCSASSPEYRSCSRGSAHHKQRLHGARECNCTIVTNGILSKVQFSDGAIRLVSC